MSKPKTKEMIQKGTNTGMDRFRQNMRDTPSNGYGASPEEYGGDKLNDGAEYIGYKVKEAAKDTGHKIKDKVSEKIRDRLREDFGGNIACVTLAAGYTLGV